MNESQEKIASPLSLYDVDCDPQRSLTIFLDQRGNNGEGDLYRDKFTQWMCLKWKKNALEDMTSARTGQNDNETLTVLQKCFHGRIINRSHL